MFRFQVVAAALAVAALAGVGVVLHLGDGGSPESSSAPLAYNPTLASSPSIAPPANENAAEPAADTRSPAERVLGRPLFAGEGNDRRPVSNQTLSGMYEPVSVPAAETEQATEPPADSSPEPAPADPQAAAPEAGQAPGTGQAPRIPGAKAPPEGPPQDAREQPPQQGIRKGDAPWSQVEKMLRELRQEKSNLDQMHALADAYLLVSNPNFTDSPDYPTHCAELGKWRDEFPDSPRPLLVLAQAHINWAWQARGGGWAGTVTEEGWTKFHTRLDESLRLLEKALKLGVDDGEAHRLRLLIGMAQDAPPEKMRSWFNGGRKLDPYYYPLYEQLAISLMPRWGGEPGDVERFANEIPTLLAGEDGLEFMGLVALHVHRYERNDPVTIRWGHYDREKLLQAADVLVRRKEKLPHMVQFAALISLLYQDHELAQRIKPLVGPFDPAHRVFVWPLDHRKFLQWADAKELPSGEESQFWHGLAGHSALAFADDSEHVWVGQVQGARAAALIDPRTGRLVDEIPHPGGISRVVALDNRQKLVAVAAARGPVTGVLFADLKNPDQVAVISEARPVESLAIHPSRTEVAWRVGQKVKVLNLASEEPTTLEIELASPRADLLYSRDGKRLAINDPAGIVVIDPASGEELHRFPTMRDRPPPSFVTRRVVDIDEEGRIWAMATEMKGPRECLVRFSADGKDPETLLPSIGRPFRHAVLSPDRRLLAVVPDAPPTGQVYAIELFDVERKTRLKPLPGHWSPIGAIAISPNGQRLASVAMDADVVKVWSLKDLQPATEENQPSGAASGPPAVPRSNP
jgi:WD40 repeat protein